MFYSLNKNDNLLNKYVQIIIHFRDPKFDKNIINLFNKKREFDEDLPGGGLHYCIGCAKHFVDANSLTLHIKTKNHKRMAKKMKQEPYDLKAAKMLSKY